MRRAGGETNRGFHGCGGRAVAARVAGGFRTDLLAAAAVGFQYGVIPARPGCSNGKRSPSESAASGSDRHKRTRTGHSCRAAVALVRESTPAGRSHVHGHTTAGHVLRV